MGLFSKKPDPHGDAVAIAAMAKAAFAHLEVETTIRAGDDLRDLELVASDGARYPLFALMQTCQAESSRRWPGIVTDHVRRLVATRSTDSKSLDAENLRRMVRARLIADVDDGSGIDFGYARPVAPGLVLALGVDYPETVSTLGSEAVAALPLGVDELFDIGQRNTDAEPIDENSEVTDGIWSLSGSSLFIASKVTAMENLIGPTLGPAPYGVVFAVPHRSLIFYTVPRDEQSILQVSTLAQLVATMAADTDAHLPGGLLSSGVYHWIDGTIELIGGTNPETGAPYVDASGRFGEVVDSLINEPTV